MSHLKGRLLSELNLIFMKSFSYSPASPPFIALIRYLISSQSFAYFANTSLFLSVEANVKYLFPFFPSLYPSTSPIIKYKELHY